MPICILVLYPFVVIVNVSVLALSDYDTIPAIFSNIPVAKSCFDTGLTVRAGTLSADSGLNYGWSLHWASDITTVIQSGHFNTYSTQIKDNVHRYVTGVSKISIVICCTFKEMMLAMGNIVSNLIQRCAMSICYS